MASEVDAQKHMSEFFRLATSLMTDPSTAWIEQVLKDNDAMKASLEQQEKEVEVIGKLLGKLHNELKLEAEKAELAVSQSEEAKTKASDLTTEMDAAKKSITEKDEQIQQNIAMISDLQTKLEARDQEIEACRQKVKEYENQRAKEVAAFKRQGQQIQSMRGELVSKTSQIEEFKQLSCELVTASRESILSELQKVYTAAKSLATRYFGEDLPDDVFKSAAFEDVRKDFKHLDIPLLASNSISAKKARMAAFLATLGSKLTARIFVPFYILPSENQDRPSEDIDDIAMMLSILSRHDRKKELHLRSVLLAISPSEQKAVAHGRGIDIAVEVSNEIGILVSGDQQLEFDQELRKFCDMAVESWECLRPLKDKVEPFDEDTSRHTEEYWLPAEFDIGTQQQKTNGLASKPSMHSLNASGPVVCVWPGFYLGGQVLRQGFMLLDSQVKPGADEQRPRQSLRALRRVSTGGLQHMRRHSTLKAKAS